MPHEQITRAQQVMARFSPSDNAGTPVLEVLPSSPWLDPGDHAPRKELSGLAPAQARALLEGDWYSRGPLKLNADLELQHLSGAPLFNDIRELLLAVREAGSLPHVAGGFDPEFAVQLVHRMPHFAEYRRVCPKRVWELDVPALGIYRRAAQRLRLIRVNQGRFRTTAFGERLAQPDQAGNLYTRMLRGVMLRPKVRNLMGLPIPIEGDMGLIRSWAYSLWALGCIPPRWQAADRLGVALAPPWVWESELLRQAPAGDSGASNRIVAAAISLGFLHFAFQLGLMEERTLKPASPDSYSEIRRTALYDRVIRFDFGPGGPELPARLKIVR